MQNGESRMEEIFKEYRMAFKWYAKPIIVIHLQQGQLHEQLKCSLFKTSIHSRQFSKEQWKNFYDKIVRSLFNTL